MRPRMTEDRNALGAGLTSPNGVSGERRIRLGGQVSDKALYGQVNRTQCWGQVLHELGRPVEFASGEGKDTGLSLVMLEF